MMKSLVDSLRSFILVKIENVNMAFMYGDQSYLAFKTYVLSENF